MIENHDRFARLIGVHDIILNCWLLIGNDGLIGNLNGFTRLTDVYDKILDF